MQYARHIASFVFVEIGLGVATVLIFTAPEVITLMSAFGFAIFAWYVATWPTLVPHYPERLTALSRIHRQAIIASIALAIGILFWGVTHAPLEKTLFATGDFGEPPDNRYVTYTYTEQPTESGRYELLIEIGVHTTDVVEPDFIFEVTSPYYFNEPGDLRGYMWACQPDITVPVEIPLLRGRTWVSLDDTPGVLKTGFGAALWPELSFCIYTFAQSPIRVVGCTIKGQYEWPPTHCGDDITLTGKVNTSGQQFISFIMP